MRAARNSRSRSSTIAKRSITFATSCAWRCGLTRNSCIWRKRRRSLRMSRTCTFPRCYEHCTPRVTAMERIFGEKVTDHALDSSGDKQRLARLVTRALVAQPIFSPSATGRCFTAIRTPGNLLYTRDGRLAILDWSLVGHLGEAERIALGQIVLAAITLARRADRRRCWSNSTSGGRSIGRRWPMSSSNWLRRIRHGQLPGLTWLVGLLDDATQTARLRVGRRYDAVSQIAAHARGRDRRTGCRRIQHRASRCSRVRPPLWPRMAADAGSSLPNSR